MPPKDLREELEREVLARLDENDLKTAATLIVRGFGPEILGFLAARFHDDTASSEAFSMFTEDLWRGLPGFEHRSSVRVWAYTIARHAALRLEASPHRRPKRNVPLSSPGALSKIADKVRTDTAPFLRTEFKDRVAKLRSQLSEEDRTLLVLRVDRQLDWSDIARVFLPPDPPPANRALTTEAARLRKRFQLVKAQIRRLAADSGLTEARDDDA